eukprot:1326212-Amphidinium_carterae.2
MAFLLKVPPFVEHVALAQGMSLGLDNRRRASPRRLWGRATRIPMRHHGRYLLGNPAVHGLRNHLTASRTSSLAWIFDLLLLLVVLLFLPHSDRYIDYSVTNAPARSEMKRKRKEKDAKKY